MSVVELPTKSGRKKKATSAEDWSHGLITNDEGRPTRCVANVMHVMSLHPAWASVLAYDAFFERVTKLRAPPVRPQDGKSEPGGWTEEDTTRTCAWFACDVGFEPSASQVDQAVAAAARRNVVHPVRDYLRALTWDGLERLDTMLATHFGASDTPYTRQVGSRWMISAVARVMQPGCQADCMLVLESEQQGTGKSTGFEKLFGTEWFADTGLHIGDKDSYQQLSGKWGYEFGELDSIKGREVTRVKNFVSARVDNYRPSYGRRNRDFPRQLVFCGTTNETQYLVDTSGNRRFWPVLCERTVDVEAIRRDRDQLWGEACARYEAGGKWHVDTPELRRLCEDEQRARQVEDPWMPTISGWLSDQAMRNANWPGEGITTTDVLAALKVDNANMSHALVTRAGHVLRLLHWRPTQLRREGSRVRLYLPESHPSQSIGKPGRDGKPESAPADNDPSHPSHPLVHTHMGACDQGFAVESMFLRRDGCDAVTEDEIDELERAAIASEARGELS